MRNVCEGCEHGKRKHPGADIYCTKYGIPVHKPRMFCVSNDPDRARVKYIGIVRVNNGTEDESE